MKEIGGYFELEFPEAKKDFIHSECTMLNSGRNSLEYILRSLSRLPRLIRLPYFTCEVVLQPIEKLGIPYSFYRINEKLEIENPPIPGNDEYVIATNYFGIKDAYIATMARNYGDRLIVDNAQAWYAPELKEIKAIYSPRKFFGLPDGGAACIVNRTYNPELKQDFSINRFSHLLKRIDENATAGYGLFHENSGKLRDVEMSAMSKLTYRILSSINFDKVREKRRRNYLKLSQSIDRFNNMTLPDIDSFACPMVYPFLTSDCQLRQRLIENKVYVATYWPNVLKWCNPDSLEYRLTENIIPLPVDQRYDEEDMSRIINIICDGRYN